MQQTEVFSHFLAGTKAHNAKKGGRRSKQAEDAEDHELVEAAEEYHAVRLTVQPECASSSARCASTSSRVSTG